MDFPPWLLIVPVLSLLIFIHEMGHFLTAKAFGIKVTEFGFGFPPRLFGVPFRGTIYSINLVPLGGFVRMVGEEDPTEPDSFARQSTLKRVIVLAAGPVMNMLLPIVIFTILFMQPHTTLLGGSVFIVAVAPGSPAEEAGLRPGDTVLSVNGQPVADTQEMVQLIEERLGQPVELNVKRGSVITGMETSPELAVFDTITLVPRKDPPSLLVVEKVTDPASQVSLAEARQYDSKLAIGDTLHQKAIGVQIGIMNPKVGKTTDPIWTAVVNSLKTIWDILVFHWNAIVEGISTKSNPGFAGPIGIAQATGEVVEELGVSFTVQLTALLSVILAVMNILPIPALDGGRLAFVIVEWLRGGKRISPQREGLAHLVGFAIMIGLILLISYSDILRIVRGESFF